LGRQPALGLAELESLYGAAELKPLAGAALLDIEAGEINFKRLGGTLKVAKVLTILPTAEWSALLKYLIESLPQHLQYLPPGTFRLGVSLYNLQLPLAQLNRDLLALKKVIRAHHRSVRIVPNKTLELNSAQVIHNQLTHKGGWELIFIRDGEQTILAQTMFVQDIAAYAARDQARPKRDARVGMLPPKLAQIIINLARPAAGARLLDPFCGTGVMLQEALLMGQPVIGSDLEPRLVDYASQNLDWLRRQFDRSLSPAKLIAADATSYRWPKFDSLASEVYLGRPLNSLPTPPALNKIVQDVNTITEKFLKNLAGQTPPGFRGSLAVPAWRGPDGQLTHLPLIAKLTSLGYNRLSFEHARPAELVYFRPNQVVARELLVLTRK